MLKVYFPDPEHVEVTAICPHCGQERQEVVEKEPGRDYQRRPRVKIPCGRCLLKRCPPTLRAAWEKLGGKGA